MRKFKQFFIARVYIFVFTVTEKKWNEEYNYYRRKDLTETNECPESFDALEPIKG